MIRALIVAAILAAMPAFAELPDTVGPWVPDTTVTIGWGGPYPLSGFGALRKPVTPCEHASGATPAGLPTMIEDDQPITMCRGHCPVPPVSSLVNDDQHTLQRVYIGVQVENASLWECPDAEDKYTEMLRQLQRWFQIGGQRMLQEGGLDIRISHVHFTTGTLDPIAPVSWNITYAIWDWLQPQLAHRAQFVLRFHEGPGGGAGCSYDPNDYAVGHSSIVWNFNFDAPPDDMQRNYINGYVAYIWQEIMHGVGCLEHTQCYLLDVSDPDTPIERCPEPAQCYAGALDCPAFDARTYMGYCLMCDGGLHPVPRMCRDPSDPICLVLRHNVNAMAAQGFLEAVGDVDRVVAALADSDGDESFDLFDNCPTVGNTPGLQMPGDPPRTPKIGAPQSWQLDRDRDGRGDACDTGCQIGTSPLLSWSRSFWIAFVAAFFVVYVALRMRR